MADSDNLFDAAIARADETIRGYMGTSATMTSGEQSGAVIRGVFDDPENISYAGQGVRVEGSSPSLFVRTDDVRQLRRGDTLTIGEENFWIDRISGLNFYSGFCGHSGFAVSTRLARTL